MASLTQERLKELLRYDPETGVWVWRISPRKTGDIAGSLYKGGYLRIRIDGRDYRCHRLAFLYMLGRWPESHVDHRDTNPANNAWSNLREATRSQNLCNRGTPKNNTSGFKGVSKNKRIGRWQAIISAGGSQYHLGYYDNPKEASEAYQRAARVLHGEFYRH
jgi:hypothetical protein